MDYNWMPITGQLFQKDDSIIFKGGKLPVESDGRELARVGLFICDQEFSEGTISVDIKFDDVSSNSCADIVLNYDPQNQYTLNAGLTNLDLFKIRYFGFKGWINLKLSGPENSLEKGKVYHLEVSLIGSTITLKSNGVEVLKHTLPLPFPKSQLGLFCVNETDIEFLNYEIKAVKPKAFVVSQFSSPFDEVYFEVIKSVCEEEGFEVIRMDEKSGPGLIIQDIANTIRHSRLVIADVSPLNANVFYEVGFSHALNIPTVLIAEKSTTLPFDISPYRVLFYENSIGGKRKLDEGLRNHIRDSLPQKDKFQ